MNKIIIICLCLIQALIFSCKDQNNDVFMFSYFVDNGADGLHLAYSYDGYNYTALKNNQSFLRPQLSKDKLMRDPCIIQGPDKLFHMVWTVSWSDRGIGYANSKDLIHWSEQKYIPVMMKEPVALNCWAPELFYDEESGEYMIYFASTIPGRFPDTDSLGDKNHRIYYTMTKDFESFSETKLLYNEGYSVIDAVIKKIKDSYYMFLKDETKTPVKKHIRIAKSNKLTEGYRLISEPISPDWVEGPTIIKVGEKWIIYYDEYTRHHMGAISSVDLKNWEVITDQINFPKGTRHGTVFKINEDLLEKIIKETD